MPRGKHAPKSSLTFYLSLARALGGAAAALGLVVAIAIVAAGGGSDEAATSTDKPSPGARQPRSTTAASPSPSPAVEGGDGKTLSPRRVSVIVLNGDGRKGLAAGMAERVEGEGYKVLDVSNEKITRTSTVFYRDGFIEEARAFVREFPEITKINPGKRGQDPDLLVVLGKDFP